MTHVCALISSLRLRVAITLAVSFLSVYKPPSMLMSDSHIGKTRNLTR